MLVSAGRSEHGDRLSDRSLTGENEDAVIVLVIPVVLMAFPVTIGFIRSRDHRHDDRRQFAAFVGFSTAAIAVIATIVGMIATMVWFPATRPHHNDPVMKNFVAVCGTIGSVLTGIAFIAGIFSRGARRTGL